jgi:hypothetical protein
VVVGVNDHKPITTAATATPGRARRAEDDQPGPPAADHAEAPGGATGSGAGPPATPATIGSRAVATAGPVWIAVAVGTGPASADRGAVRDPPAHRHQGGALASRARTGGAGVRAGVPWFFVGRCGGRLGGEGLMGHERDMRRAGPFPWAGAQAGLVWCGR